MQLAIIHVIGHCQNIKGGGQDIENGCLNFFTAWASSLKFQGWKDTLQSVVCAYNLLFQDKNIVNISCSTR